MTEPQSYFVAILPKGELHSRILGCKSRLMNTVGSQLYLGDPPHLTIFLASFQDRDLLRNAFNDVASQLYAPEIEIDGWHVFESDCLTGNNTLVCQIEDASKERLRAIQSKVISRLAGLRDQESSFRRYQHAWETLSDVRRDAVKRVGFPFVGADWQPHFTIASIRPDVWQSAWNELEHHSILGIFNEFELALFALERNEPLQLTVVPLS